MGDKIYQIKAKKELLWIEILNKSYEEVSLLFFLLFRLLGRFGETQFNKIKKKILR